MQIPFSPPDITEAEIEAVAQAMRSGWITTGPRTKELEKKVAERCGTLKAACLNSATAALELALRVLEIGPGDEVITAAYTYTASASVIDHVGATIKLVDCAPGSFEIDYGKLSEVITPKTKAIIPVDFAGKPINYDRLYKELEACKHLFTPQKQTLQELFDRVIVLSDAAHSFGCSYHNVNSGQLGDFTSFSFHAVKNFTTAEGGALTWKQRPGLDDEEVYKRVMNLSLHGQTKDALSKTKLGSWEYDITSPAFKCNMTDIAAAIGLVQYERYDDLIDRRRDIVAQYNKGLEESGIIPLDHFEEGYYSNCHLYITRLEGADIEKRNAFIERMAEAGIACNVHYKPLPLLTAYKNLGFDMKDYPVAYDQFATEVTLPLHTLLTDEQVAYVIEHARTCYEELC